MKHIMLDEFKVTIYGEGELKVEDGVVVHQSYIAYGESKVEANKIENGSTSIRAFGEGDFRINVSDRLQVSAFGEAQITYHGSPTIHKGLVVGEATIRKSESTF
jgi:hypothetical protein